MAETLKNQFFQRPFFTSLSKRIKAEYPDFDSRRFFRLLHDADWEGRELKARMRHASEVLGQTLPQDYRNALGILLQVEKHFRGFDHLLFADFVERFGVDDYQASIPALERLTRTTAEFAIRPFIEKYPKKTMAQMKKWARSKHEHVRRLASEGCRPRLPWGAALAEFKKDPRPILPILDQLKADPSEMVRRSVANNLGDIAKDNPDIALATARRWLKESRDHEPLLKHGLRSLLKKGDSRALALFGLDVKTKAKVTRLAVVPKRIRIGETAQLDFELVSGERTAKPVRLEYVIEYARPNGRASRKVFQIKQVRLQPGKPVQMRRKLSFADRSTRKHHPGDHSLTLVVNGNPAKTTRFSLVL